MKKINFYSLIVLLTLAEILKAQCIKDVQTLINMPAPCFFVGSIDFENTECFDPFSSIPWNYTWKIKKADDGELVAQYDGLAFQHTFAKFGGYTFCLEVDKDGDPSNTPEIIDCVTYTTCEICTEDSIKINYNSCPYGEGCDVTLSAKIHSANDVGLKPVAKFIVTYLPTPQELLGDVEPYDIEFGDIDIEYNPFKDSIFVSQNLTVPFKRGCFKPRIEFQLEDGAGAHGTDGIACTEVALRSEEKFRCIACANQDGDCIASLVASQISNEEDTCDPFYFCNQLRENESVNVSAFGNASLVASPNPAKDKIHFELPSSTAEFRKLVVYNNVGQIIYQLEIQPNDNSAEINAENLQSGLYFVSLVENGKMLQKTKVVVQH